MLFCTTSGGMVQMATLRLLAETAAEHGNGTLHFTADQHIALPGVTDSRRGRVQQLLPEVTLLGTRPTRRLLSTAPFAGAGEGRAWLRPGVFSDLLQSLADTPVTGLFVGDAAQHHVPVPFTRVRVLARAGEDQWELAVARRNGNTDVLPGYLRGARVADALRRIAPLVAGPNAETELPLLIERVDDLLRSAPREAPQSLGRFYAPDDLLILMGPIGSWDAAFVQALCQIAQAHGIAAAGITATRALAFNASPRAREVIVDCCMAHRFDLDGGAWRRFMLVGDGQDELANALLARLHAACPINTGFAIAVQAHDAPAQNVHFAISAMPRTALVSRLRGERFTLQVRDPGSALDTTPRQCLRDLDMAQLVEAMLTQIRKWLKASVTPPKESPAAAPAATRPLHICRECETAYDEQHGDPLGGIEVGTQFDALPETWCCPVCDAPKGAYRHVGQQRQDVAG